MNAIRIMAALLLVAMATPGWAHGIWFAQRAGRLALVYGEGAEDVEVFSRRERITALQAFDAAGRPVTVQTVPAEPMLFVSADGAAAVLATTMDNGHWSRLPSGKWMAGTKDTVPGATTTGRYLKYGTHLLALPAGEMGPVAGMAFQIVAVGKRFPQRSGEVLTLRVLHEGRPLPGVEVWPDLVNDPDGASVRTDADGLASVSVRNQGLNVIRAEYVARGDGDGKVDLVEHFATLSFVLKPPAD
ncbi:MAG: DUF4198 domain-containing protein [Methyloversatilis discipulorum]|uniref:DUF4198 domain-containing protein n=1 Tax=Methyloversatilis discipulorum TaxID=1119528 RepID=UPI0026EC7761|nr:DUF4198 domain-containing protein [Methyloversatilis discipulorum]MBV5286907.1 DUF4198 domain-containing protein [Methyloversatilis discipulorum]